ncbi:hypothetical protein [Streptomyces sp. ODS28]|uniref:hypothetical protein n=1 Tax=Streptomyces sp. ODS28 TaxID=3136688 RepID=UPI0031EDC0C6
MTPPVSAAVLALVAGALHDLHPTAYDPTAHPVDPAAQQDAEHLLAALAEQGVTLTPPPAPQPPTHTDEPPS